MNPFQSLIDSYEQNPSEATLRESLAQLFRLNPVVKSVGVGIMRTLNFDGPRRLGPRFMCQLILAAINREPLNPNLRVDDGELVFQGEDSPFAKDSFKSFLVEHQVSSENLEHFGVTLLALSTKHEDNMEQMNEFIRTVREVCREVFLDEEE